MFDIGWGELLVIGIVALIAIGPKELPGVLRSLGHWMTRIRRMASEFQGQFNEAMREAEMADLKKQVEDTARGITQYDPINDPDGVNAMMQPIPPAKPAAPETAPPAPADTAQSAMPEPQLETPKPGEGRPS